MDNILNLVKSIKPGLGWAKNGAVFQQIVVLLVAPIKPLYDSLPPASKPALLGSVQGAVFAAFAGWDDVFGWDFARMDEPAEDAFYKAFAQSKVQEVLTGNLQMNR